MARKVVVVTGAGSGIGRATAQAFLRRGDAVALLGRREAALADTVRGGGQVGEAMIIATDVTREQEVEAAFNAVASRFGRIDLLFNNAGSFPLSAPFDETALADWSHCIDTNLTGAFLCARAAFRCMKGQDPQGGRIINNGSVSAQTPRPFAVSYTAAKHGMTGLTKAISLEGRAYQIACGQIDIGNAETEMLANNAPSFTQANGQRAVEASMPLASVVDAIVYTADLPLSANVQWMTLMATAMPMVGRG